MKRRDESGDNSTRSGPYQKIESIQAMMHCPIPRDGNNVPWFVSTMNEILFEHIEGTRSNEELQNENFLAKLDDWILDIFTVANETSRIDAPAVGNNKKMREYHFRICSGKMCHYTSLFISCTYIQTLKDKLEGLMGIPKKDPREFLRSKELLMSEEPISTWTQMDLYEQVLLLAQRWYLIPFSSHIFETVRCIFSRLSFLVYYQQPEKVMNGILNKHKKMAEKSGTSQLYALSIEFIDTLSCIYQDFMNSLIIHQVVHTRMTHLSLDELLEEENLDANTITENIEAWIEHESCTIGDDRFKEKLRDFCITNSLHCGELNRVIRDGGVLPTNGVSVIEKTRTSNQLTWWATMSVQKSIGIKLNRRLPIIRNSSIIMIFDSYCQSVLRFDWANTVLLTEKRFLNKIEDCLLYTSPLIFQSMGSFHVYFQNYWYDTESIEMAIFMWLFFLKKGKWKYSKLSCESKNLSKIEVLYDLFTREKEMEIEVETKHDKTGAFKIPL